MGNHEFDRFATDYREIHTQNIGKVSGVDSDYFSEYKIKELYERKNVSGQGHMLDLGCGDGNTFKYIKKYFPCMKYRGIDVSEECILKARGQTEENEYVEFQCYDGEKIPYEDDSFDVIFIACVLHHIRLAHRKGILKECYRVLKQKGKIIVFEHNPYNPVTMRMVNTCPFDEDAVLVKPKECKYLFSEIGMHGSIRYTIFIPRKSFLKKLIGVEKMLGRILFGGQYYGVFQK